MVDFVLSILGILLELALWETLARIWDRIGRPCKYIWKCLKAAGEWVRECVRERKIKQP